MPAANIQDPAGFNELSKAEQIRYVQDRWDRIAGNPYDVPVPRSHLDLAEMRLIAHRHDPGAAWPATDVIAKLRGKAR